MKARNPVVLGTLFLALPLSGCPARNQARDERAPAAAADAARQATTSTNPEAENYAGPELPSRRVVLRDVYGGPHAVQVEIAATPEARQRGLMWRRELSPGKGMLFVFPDERRLSFWMKNTLIPLDMIFIDSEGKIVGIVPNAEPQTLTSRSVLEEARYVLEVPGGYTVARHIRAGSKVELPEGLNRYLEPSSDAGPSSAD